MSDKNPLSKAGQKGGPWPADLARAKSRAKSRAKISGRISQVIDVVDEKGGLARAKSVWAKTDMASLGPPPAFFRSGAAGPTGPKVNT